ncbi:MAG: ExbD/TolR family protein [Desulfovibrio sp.]|nr:ExbD/TolR family protein [Desulfovibrio sp.]
MAESSDDFVSEINVTPFVDVMMVLLIIFMVTAPMMTEGLDVDLPKVEAAETLPTEDDHAILTIKPDGVLFLDEYPTSLDDLKSVLEINILQKKKQLFLRADEKVPYGLAMKVMGKIRAAGIHDLGLVSLSEGKSQDAGRQGQAPQDGAPEK